MHWIYFHILDLSHVGCYAKYVVTSSEMTNPIAFELLAPEIDC